ncbi:MAG: FHA domain-containing protein [Pirellulales bacterium]|nr:FHA domain-containing protein [Pirellulales bacterium]
MQVKLIVVSGKANKGEVAIELPATIGRSRDADLTVGHGMISRKHCEAYLVDGLMMIRDAGSLNGTYVHGQRIQEAPLLPDEKFTIGPITFRVKYEYSGDRSKLPPIVPAESIASAAAAAVAAEAAEPKTEPVKEEVSVARDEAEPAKEEPLATPPDKPKDEPDFEMVDDDDFELTFQELPEEKAAPESPKKVEPSKDAGQEAPKKVEPKKEPAQEPPKEDTDSEKDPEDQLLDDFLNDIQ